jgi:hypothetical protein
LEVTPTPRPRTATVAIDETAANAMVEALRKEVRRLSSLRLEPDYLLTLLETDIIKRELRTLTGMQDEIAGDCTKIATLIDKWASSCKQLVENPGLRLKKLSECTNEGKVGC